MSEADNVQKFEVRVFPDSGHHFTFIPLSPKHAKIAKLKKFCMRNKGPWAQLEKYPWIRYRIGSQGNEAGVHVAIESNLGTVKRGSMYEPRREVMLESAPDLSLIHI